MFLLLMLIQMWEEPWEEVEAEQAQCSMGCITTCVWAS